ncbi:MAG: hypothetical protein ACKVWV_19145 [Planctomycetota bacterium]
MPSLTKCPRLLFAALGLVLVFFAPMWVTGSVIHPHDNRLEVGMPPSEHAPHRQLSDLSSVFVPDIHHQLHGDRSSWMSLWNPHVQLGRPSTHLSGLSPAFPLSRVLFLAFDDAAQAYTALVVATILLAAVFGYLLLAELGLHACACFAGASAFALGVFSTGWLTFAMFPAGICWTLAILWSVVRYTRQPSLGRGVWLAFSVYALLMTGYPQQIVWHAYVLVPFTLVRVWRDAPSFASQKRAIGGLALAVAVGGVCALPCLADVALAAMNSARVDTDASFFLERMPAASTFGDRLTILLQAFDVFTIGDPFAEDAQIRFAGVCWTPLFAGLALISCLEGGWRRAWPWMAFVLVGFAMVLWPPVYQFGIEHLGLNLSRFLPLGGVWIACIVCASLALDRVLRDGFRRPWIAAAIVAASLVLPFAWASVNDVTPRWTYVAVASAIGIGLVALVFVRKPLLAGALVVVSALHYGWASAIWIPERDIARTSPLVERLQASTADGSRYACVGTGEPRLLPPNQEVLYDLRSIHSYDSLSPTQYQEWVLRVSEVGARQRGRQFRRVSSVAQLGSEDVALGGVSTLVSPERLRAPMLADELDVDGNYVYRMRTPPLLQAQFASFRRYGSSGREVACSVDEPISTPRLPLQRRERHDDRSTFDVTPSAEETLLFVSQQHHPHWIAKSGEAALECVAVNGFYLGVIVPPNTREVTIEFRPWARWSWVPQAFFALAAIAGWRAARRARAVSADGA